MPYCVAFGCSNSTDVSCPGVSFHCLPTKEPERLKAWLATLKLVDPPVRDKNARVCSEHFLPECFTTYMQERLTGKPCRRRLKEDAVPTVFCFSKAPAKRQASERRKVEKRSKNAVQQAFQESPATASVLFDDPPETIEDLLPGSELKFKSVGVQTGTQHGTWLSSGSY